MIDSIERMTRAECKASGSPRSPESEYFDQYPLTENDPKVTEIITSTFRNYFGAETVLDLGQVTASEDFSHIPDALRTPYIYWGVGCTYPEKYEQARKAGRVEQDVPVNHSEFFAPAIQPTLTAGTQALKVAALTYLAK